MDGKGVFDRALKIPTLALNIAGVDIVKGNHSLTRRFTFSFIFYFNLINLSFDLFGEAKSIADKLHTQFVLGDISYPFTCLGISLMSAEKIIYSYVHQERISIIKNKFRALHPNLKGVKEYCTDSKDGFHKEVNDAISFLNMTVRVISYSSITLCAAVILTSVVIEAYIYFTSGEIKIIYSIDASYPLIDLSDVRIWPILYLHQGWSVILTLVYLVANDTVFYAFRTFIHIQFKLLGYRIRSTINRSQLNKQDVNQKVLYKEICEIVVHHQEIIKLIAEIDDIYSKSMFINFTLSSVFICFTGINVVIMQDKTHLLNFLLGLITCVLQIFLVCYFGNMVTSSSLQFNDDICRSDWVLGNKKVRKAILLMTTRTQKPPKLTAYKYTNINLLAFTSILSTSWSYFALLRTMYSSS